MYSQKEIITIFQNCGNWSELEKACNALCYVINIGEFSNSKIALIKLKSTERFRELENL